jgi:hypothetical protein
MLRESCCTTAGTPACISILVRKPASSPYWKAPALIDADDVENTADNVGVLNVGTDDGDPPREAC